HRGCWARCIARGFGPPDADGDVLTWNERALGYGPAQSVPDDGSVGGVRSRQDDGELLSTDPAQGLLGPNHLPGHGGDAPQDVIPGEMAVDIVHPLEIVDVEHQDAEG